MSKHKKKLPKDLTGQDLVKKLEKFGYKVIRQKGSHIRIRTEEKGVHSETIPNHAPLRDGTLNAILLNVSNHLGLTKEQLLQELMD